MKNTFLFLLLFSLSLFSCEKEKVLTKDEQLLIQRPWKITEIKIKHESKPDSLVDISCISDDTWTMYEDGTAKLYYSTNCNRDYPESFETWWVSGKKLIRKRKGHFMEEESDILVLNDSTLVLTKTLLKDRFFTFKNL